MEGMLFDAGRFGYRIDKQLIAQLFNLLCSEAAASTTGEVIDAGLSDSTDSVNAETAGRRGNRSVAISGVGGDLNAQGLHSSSPNGKVPWSRCCVPHRDTGPTLRRNELIYHCKSDAHWTRLWSNGSQVPPRGFEPLLQA